MHEHVALDQCRTITEVVTQVLTKLRDVNEWRRSAIPTTRMTCVYHHPSGRCCAIGWVVPREISETLLALKPHELVERIYSPNISACFGGVLRDLRLFHDHSMGVSVFTHNQSLRSLGARWDVDITPFLLSETQ
jgi:hypothetical protein